jgi:hypothetical protein
MTKKELVDLTCIKMHRTDEPSRQEAAAYVQARYRIIYDSRIWNDTIGPPLVLNGTMFFNEFGIPITDEQGNILRSGIAGQVIILPYIVGLVISCRWEQQAGLLHVEEMAQQFRIHPETFEAVGEPIGFSIISPSATTMSPGGGKVSIYSSDTNARYSVSIRGSLGETDQAEVIRASGTSPVYSRYSYDEIGSLGKDDQSFDLIVEDQSGGNLLTLPSNETSRLHQRIAFTSTPSNSGALAVLYKKRCRDLIFDSDSTEISKIDNTLLAAAIGDMREGERQYGKASAKAQEVAGLMSTAISMEKEQSANNCRIIPELIHSPDWTGRGD